MTQKEYKRTMYLLNREKRMETMRLYYQANRDRLIAYQRQYRLKRKESA